MASKDKSISEIVNDHKPKNYKFKFIVKDETLWKELEEQQYDISSLDTINDSDLTVAALNTSFKEYPRETVSSAKKPTSIDNGVIISKKMITKADKKLQSVNIGFFTHNNVRYVCVKFVYERFDIIEIFILT